MDTAIFVLIVLVAVGALAWRFYRTWRTPSDCGCSGCGCAKNNLETYDQDTPVPDCSCNDEKTA